MTTLDKPNGITGFLTRLVLSDNDFGSQYRRQEIVASRLTVIAKNLSAPVFAGLLSFFLGSPAILVVTVFMMVIGSTAMFATPSRKERLIESCRRHVWTMIISAATARFFIDWATSQGRMGLSAMLGSHTHTITQMVGTEILPIMLDFAIILIPVLYVKVAYTEWHTTRSKGDTQRKISLIGRYRKARPY